MLQVSQALEVPVPIWRKENKEANRGSYVYLCCLIGKSIVVRAGDQPELARSTGNALGGTLMKLFAQSPLILSSAIITFFYISLWRPSSHEDLMTCL